MGSIALVAGAVLATVAGVVAVLSPRRERPVLGSALVLLTAAAIHIVVLLIREDTSYTIVVDHTRPGLDVFRRVMGLWGGSEGSLLLFTVIVGWVLVGAPLQSPLVLARSVVVAVLSWSVVLVSWPFERLDNPAIAGGGLSPILEHWAMMIHPPLLYLGLALALVPGAVQADRRRAWAVRSIAVLTVALALGGGWAYVELGWGGWWAWDPVENAALIPWLLLVASLHAPPAHRVARWTTLAVWPLVFAGTAMTRTSLRTSVHAFANAEALAWTLWPLTLVVAMLALAHARRQDVEPDNSLSRRVVLPVGILVFSAIVVALGTFRPFVPGDGTDGSFYTRSLFGFVVVGLVGFGVAPRIGRAAPGRLLAEGAFGAALGIGAAAAVGWTNWWQLTLAAAIGAGAATIVGAGLHPLPRTLAHLGMVAVIAGALGGTASTTQTFSLAADASADVDGVRVTNRGVSLDNSTPQPVISASIDLDGTLVEPALTVYPERALRLPEVATMRRLDRDVQVTLRSADDSGTATITVNVEPLTQLVWAGAVLITASMGLSARPVSRRASLVESEAVR